MLKRLHQIPQARPADHSAFRYIQNVALPSLGCRICLRQSEKPKLPQGKPAGFIVPRGLSGGVQPEASDLLLYYFFVTIVC